MQARAPREIRPVLAWWHSLLAEAPSRPSRPHFPPFPHTRAHAIALPGPQGECMSRVKGEGRRDPDGNTGDMLHWMQMQVVRGEVWRLGTKTASRAQCASGSLDGLHDRMAGWLDGWWEGWLLLRALTMVEVTYGWQVAAALPRCS
jgi:hypothetical protein